jgi:hypothetical protein
MIKVLTLALALAAFTLTTTFAQGCCGGDDGTCKKDAKPAPSPTAKP